MIAHRMPRRFASTCAFVGLVVAAIAQPAVAGADFATGVSDDRVSLPEGPGSLEGVGENVNIDANMATMRWSIPIDVPEGFDGAQPSLALAYSSGAGSSVAGIGWTFDVPYVERMTARGLPEYDETDLFAANGGDELVRITPNAASASTPAIYRSRFEREFVRWSWLDRDGGENGYWKAEYGDGSVGYFGATSAGVTVASARVAGDEGTFRYHLVDKVDTEGHVLHYTWEKEGTTSLLAKAEYVFRADGTARYRVEVDYEDRDDHQSDCKAGFEDVLTKRITRISVFSQNEPIRRYVLSYDAYGDAGGQSRLAKVETRGRRDELYPIVQSFTYSRSLGVNCNATSCGRPTIVNMGDIGGASLRSGKATLIDMNGDSLPDIVDTTAIAGGRHRFFFNTLEANGDQGFSAAVTSSIGTAAGHALGTRPVQVIDQDGNGFTDIVNGLTGEVLSNDGSGDWKVRLFNGAGFPSNAEDNELRFIDIDNDKRIDAIRSEAGSTTVLRSNEDGTFSPFVSEAVGFSFSGQNVELTDMNGDGLLDVVRMSPDTLSYKLNYGRGKWGPLVTIPVAMSDVEDDLARLEDMNGDGLSDLVIVSGTRVKYLLNRNGVAFDAPVLVESAVGGSIPERLGDTVVLTADMNGNGSTDIVWIQTGGEVIYLDVFPVRQHLMTKIENGIGRVTDITYTTSVLEAAAAAAAQRPWAYQVPFPNTVVKMVDEYDLLTNVHDVGVYQYFDGFYDGIERTYRGYELVELRQDGDEHQEGSLTTMQYDVGADGDPWRAGLKLRQDIDGEDRALQSQSWTFEVCAIAEVPDGDALEALGRKPIRRYCEVESTTTIKEGRPESEWIVTRTTREEDGYGNTIEMAELGVVDVTGDERYRTWSFVDPTQTNGLWMIGAIVNERISGLPGPALGFERITYYDGTPFVGLPAGQLTLGHQTRVAERVDADTFEDVTRQRNNDDGQVVELYDALGVVGEHANRSTWTYDADGLLITQTALHLNDAAGAPYSLVRRYAHDPAFDKPVQATAWIRVVDGEDRSPRNDMFFGYDNFGRLTSRVRPGDSAAAPTEVFEYELGSPTTRVVTKRRTGTAGFDLEQVECLDGRGRAFQKRSKIDDDQWLVDGFTVFNLRGEKLSVSQPYSSTSGACDTAPPEGVLATTFHFDAANRKTRVVEPDGAIFETVYVPLAEQVRDPGDIDETSSSFETPIVLVRDGLERITRVERRRANGQNAAVFQIKYDDNLNLAGYIDPAENEKTQTFDLRRRVTSIDDPNSGRQTMGYDAASNMIRRENGDGVVLRAAYDGANRLVERWNDADRAGSLVRAHYDVVDDCAAGDCSNIAGMLAGFSWPGGGQRNGYDGRGNPLFTSREIEGVDYATRYTWDHADRPVSTTYPDGREITTTLDGMDRPIAIPGVVDTIAYDDRGLLERMVFANGVTTARRYDARMRQTAITTGTAADDLLDLEVAWDSIGNVQRTVDNLDVAGFSLDATNSYDEWHRLLSTAFDDETATFTYDVIDNLLSSTSTKVGSTANVGALEYEGFGPSAVSKVGTRVYEYDGAGQLTKRGETALTWDHMGRMTSARDNGVETGRFVYGEAADRVAKIEKTGVVHYVSDDYEVRDGIGVIYVRVAAVRVARLESKAISLTTMADVGPVDDLDGELNAGDAWVAHAAGAGIVDATVPADADAGRLLLAAARRLLHDEGPKTAYLHRDHLNSAVLATDVDGEVVGRETFHAFGETRARDGFVDAYAFTGQEIDASTGLMRFKHRYLDANAGRWISPDPLYQLTTEKFLSTPDEMATGYGYASNNPTSFIDPDGLNPVSAAGNGIMAVGKAILAVRNKIAAFAKKHPRIATAIRVGLTVTAAALTIAGAVATGGAATLFIVAVAAATTVYKAKNLAQDYSDLTQTRDPIKRDKAANRVANGMMLDCIGVVTGGLSVGGVLGPPTALGAAISKFGTALSERVKKANL